MNISTIHTAHYIYIYISPRGVAANVSDCDIIVSEIEFQFIYRIYIQTNTLGKGMNPLSSSNGANSIPTVLQRWLCH